MITIVSFYLLAFRMKWREIMPLLLGSLAHKIPPFITPNHISIFGSLFLLVAALFIYLAQYNYYYFLWTVLFILIFSIADSLDGILARLRHKITKTGTYLDSTLGWINLLLLLLALILGKHVRPDLVVMTMIFSLFYNLTNMESLSLTGQRFTENDRPRWLVLAMVLCLSVFFSKLLGLEATTFGEIQIRNLDAIFSVLVVYYITVLLVRNIALWNKLVKLDRET